MKLTKTKGKGNLLQLEIKEAPDWYVNTLRRLAVAEVPVMAIESVEISRNDGVLYDEMVAHRLGLVPLFTDLDSYVLPTKEERESGEYLAQSSCKLTLEAKGPCVVLAKDLVSNDPKVKPVYPDMPITKLLEGQELRLIATAVLGLGRDHAKWSPAHAHYKHTALDDTTNEPEKELANDFTLTIESWGQLKPDQIITTAVERHTMMLKEFDDLLAQEK